MYLSHYRLNDKPFKLTYDPAYYYPFCHQRPFIEACYVIERGHALATLQGEPGTGKTALLKRLEQTLGGQYRVILLSDASPGRKSILLGLYEALGIASSTTRFGAERLGKYLEKDLDGMLVLLVDEAQNLSLKQLFELQLLTNQEASGEQLVSIILAGQPSLGQLLRTREARALRQRVTVRIQVEPLDLEHTKKYIEHHLRTAGSRDAEIFPHEAVKAIHQHSRGIPRLINLICEYSLICGFVEHVKMIDEAIVQEALSSLQLADDEESSTPVERDAKVRSPRKKKNSGIALLEKKVDAIAQMLIRGGVTNPDHIDDVRMRNWVKRLNPDTQNTADENADNMLTIESPPRARD